MDAFLKCLLACVISLMPTGISSYSSHLISDQNLVSRFASKREQYQDLVLDMLIANQPPKVVLRDSQEPSHKKMENYSTINKEMHDLDIRTITINGNRIAFRLDETKNSAKDLVWLPYGFRNCKSEDCERNGVSRIDDDWGLAYISNTN